MSVPRGSTVPNYILECRASILGIDLNYYYALGPTTVPTVDGQNPA